MRRLSIAVVLGSLFFVFLNTSKSARIDPIERVVPITTAWPEMDDGDYEAFCFSNDGKKIALLNTRRTRTVRIYDKDSRRLVQEIVYKAKGASQVFLSDQSQYAIVDGLVRKVVPPGESVDRTESGLMILDCAKKSIKKELWFQLRMGWAASFPDGALLAIPADKNILIYDIKKDEMIARSPDLVTYPIRTVFSRDGSTVGFGFPHGILGIYNYKTQAIKYSERFFDHSSRLIRFNRDGTKMASFSTDLEQVIVVDCKSGSTILKIVKNKELTMRESCMQDMRFSDEGDKLALLYHYFGLKVCVLEIPSGKFIERFDLEMNPQKYWTSSFKFSPTGKTVAGLLSTRDDDPNYQMAFWDLPM